MSSNTNQAGKGDKPRPVNKKIYNANYDAIFDKSSRTIKATKVKVKNGKTTYKY